MIVLNDSTLQANDVKSKTLFSTCNAYFLWKTRYENCNNSTRKYAKMRTFM